MKLTWRRQTLRPMYHFATSRVEIDARETIVVQVEHDGVVGIGEVVPAELTGDSLPSCEKSLESVRDMPEIDATDVDRSTTWLLRQPGIERQVVCGIETALFDWAGRKAGKPLWQLLGLERPSKATVLTIGLGDQAEIMSKVSDSMDAGYEALNVKVGVPTDHETLSVVRSIYHGPLFVDADGAWSPTEAVQKLPGMARYAPAQIQQPVAPENASRLAEIQALGVAPIFVRDGCNSSDDVPALRDRVNGIVVELSRCGGILAARRMISAAREHGLKVMLGSAISSSAAIAPALALACLADLISLDGALLLEFDPFEGVTVNGGMLELGDRAGCGISPRSG